MTKVRLEGFKDLDKALGELTEAAGKGVMRRALKSAATPVADAARGMAPVGDTGNLAASVAYGTKLTKRQAKLHRKAFKSDKASVEGFIGANDPAAVQQEFGNVNHGPQPFLRPAWDAGKGKVLADLATELGNEVQKAAARAARKAARQAAKG